MKIQQLEFVIAISQEGSITKAAQKLYQAQPNISSSLKDLEQEIGFKIFRRVPEGMKLTPEGMTFLTKATQIVESMHALRSEYCASAPKRLVFSIAFSYSAYASDTISRLITDFCESHEHFELHVTESNTNNVLDSLSMCKANLGLIHVPEIYMDEVGARLRELGLSAEILHTFRMKVMMRRDHPLAQEESIPIERLWDYPELIFETDEPLMQNQARIGAQYDYQASKRKIIVSTRDMQISLMQTFPNAYMWVSPVPKQKLEEKGFVVKPCAEADCTNIALLIYRENLEKDPMIRTITARIKSFIAEKL